MRQRPGMLHELPDWRSRTMGISKADRRLAFIDRWYDDGSMVISRGHVFVVGRPTIRTGKVTRRSMTKVLGSTRWETQSSGVALTPTSCLFASPRLGRRLVLQRRGRSGVRTPRRIRAGVS